MSASALDDFDSDAAKPRAARQVTFADPTAAAPASAAAGGENKISGDLPLFAQGQPCRMILHVHCRNLTRQNSQLPTSPLIVLYEKDNAQKRLVYLDQTEYAKDNPSPDFDHEFEFEHFYPLSFIDPNTHEVKLQSGQPDKELRLSIYHVEDGHDVQEEDLIGCVEVTLNELAASVPVAGDHAVKMVGTEVDRETGEELTFNGLKGPEITFGVINLKNKELEERLQQRGANVVLTCYLYPPLSTLSSEGTLTHTSGANDLSLDDRSLNSSPPPAHKATGAGAGAGAESQSAQQSSGQSPPRTLLSMKSGKLAGVVPASKSASDDDTGDRSAGSEAGAIQFNVQPSRAQPSAADRASPRNKPSSSSEPEARQLAAAAAAPPDSKSPRSAKVSEAAPAAATRSSPGKDAAAAPVATQLRTGATDASKLGAAPSSKLPALSTLGKLPSLGPGPRGLAPLGTSPASSSAPAPSAQTAASPRSGGSPRSAGAAAAATLKGAAAADDASSDEEEEDRGKPTTSARPGRGFGAAQPAASAAAPTAVAKDATTHELLGLQDDSLSSLQLSGTSQRPGEDDDDEDDEPQQPRSKLPTGLSLPSGSGAGFSLGQKKGGGRSKLVSSLGVSNPASPPATSPKSKAVFTPDSPSPLRPTSSSGAAPAAAAAANVGRAKPATMFSADDFEEEFDTPRKGGAAAAADVHGASDEFDV